MTLCAAEVEERCSPLSALACALFPAARRSKGLLNDDLTQMPPSRPLAQCLRCRLPRTPAVLLLLPLPHAHQATLDAHAHVTVA